MPTIALGKVARTKTSPLTLTGDVGTVTIDKAGNVTIEVPDAVMQAGQNNAQRWAASLGAQTGDVVGSVALTVSTPPPTAGALMAWSMAGLYVLRWERSGAFSVAVTTSKATDFVAALAKQVAEIDAKA